MQGHELIPFFISNFPVLAAATSPIVAALITVFFNRGQVSQTQFEKLKASKFDEVLDDLQKEGKVTYYDLYKMHNFKKIAKLADERIGQLNTENKYINGSFDWYAQFYESCGNVTDSDMQELWGRLLAGEVSGKSSYSLRAIDTLRTLSKDEAKLFDCVCNYAICYEGSMFLLNNDNFLNKYGINYSHIMNLDSCGLINPGAFVSRSFTIDKSPLLLFDNGRYVITLKPLDVNNKSVEVLVYPFTSVGNELASLVDRNIGDDVIIDMGKALNCNDFLEDNDHVAGVHEIKMIKGDQIVYKVDSII